MRTLNSTEIAAVSGGEGVCTPSDSGTNNIGGVGDPERFGDFLIDVYEGVVSATSHVIERVANSF